MFMNIIVILLVLGLGYTWMVRGAFSSMIHLLCAVAAGAIAFSFWEMLSMILIDVSPERGFFSFLEGIARGVSLIFPFAALFLIFRFLTDKVVPNNIRNSRIVDYVGGGIFGLGTGVISAGILVIGIGSMRIPTNFLGYQPLWYSADRAIGAGALVRTDTLWIPVDKLTSAMYQHLSIGTMSSSEPLAKWYPELELVGFSARVSPGDGGGRNAINSEDFNVRSTYTVGNIDGSGQLTDLLSDSRDDQPQKYIDINSDPVTNGYLAGYVIEFEPGAKERGKKGGQLVVSNGQYRLLIEDTAGNTMSVFPVATISESGTADEFGRWRFDAKDVFITSVGGKSRVPMAFEFVIPQGYTPISLFVKNVRVHTDSLPKAIVYSDTKQRDKVVRSGSILKGESAARKLDSSKVVRYDASVQDSFVRITTAVGEMMSSQVAKPEITLDDKIAIVEGEGIYDIKTEAGRRNAPTSKKLRVEKYALSQGQKIIKVNVSIDSEIGLFSEAAREANLDAPLLLIDDKGNEYEAVGFEYTDSKIYHVRITRGSTLSGIQDTPDLSQSRDDQKLQLLFVVTRGVQISHFTIGDVAVARFTPPIDTSN
jgi:hypothetical protein